LTTTDVMLYLHKDLSFLLDSDITRGRYESIDTGRRGAEVTL